MFALSLNVLIHFWPMLYSTIVQRDETGLTQIYEAAKELEDLNVLEAILLCKFDIRKVEQTLNLVRMYQARLNIESMELVAFSENFIEEYATDNNKCFHIALKLVRKIGTTITGSMKIFRKYCPIVRKRLEGSDNIVPVLDYSRLTFRQYHIQIFGLEPYCDLVKTLLHEQATLFYHLKSRGLVFDSVPLCAPLLIEVFAYNSGTFVIPIVFSFPSCYLYSIR